MSVDHSQVEKVRAYQDSQSRAETLAIVRRQERRLVAIIVLLILVIGLQVAVLLLKVAG